MEDAGQLAIEARVAEQHTHHSHGQFYVVWGVLLALTAIEVYLGYQNMEPKRMLSILMCLSIVKAALIIGYFMHMKFEVSRMKWLTQHVADVDHHAPLDSPLLQRASRRPFSVSSPSTITPCRAIPHADIPRDTKTVIWSL